MEQNGYKVALTAAVNEGNWPTSTSWSNSQEFFNNMVYLLAKAIWVNYKCNKKPDTTVGHVTSTNQLQFLPEDEIFQKMLLAIKGTNTGLGPEAENALSGDWTTIKTRLDNIDLELGDGAFKQKLQLHLPDDDAIMELKKEMMGSNETFKTSSTTLQVMVTELETKTATYRDLIQGLEEELKNKHDLEMENKQRLEDLAVAFEDLRRETRPDPQIDVHVGEEISDTSDDSDTTSSNPEHEKSEVNNSEAGGYPVAYYTSLQDISDGRRALRETELEYLQNAVYSSAGPQVLELLMNIEGFFDISNTDHVKDYLKMLMPLAVEKPASRLRQNAVARHLSTELDALWSLVICPSQITVASIMTHATAAAAMSTDLFGGDSNILRKMEDLKNTCVERQVTNGKLYDALYRVLPRYAKNGDRNSPERRAFKVFQARSSYRFQEWCGTRAPDCQTAPHVDFHMKGDPLTGPDTVTRFNLPAGKQLSRNPSTGQTGASMGNKRKFDDRKLSGGKR